MRAAFYTLGCKVNQYETSVLMQQFAAAGYDIVEPAEEADVYVVNSCTVTAAGDKKSRQALRRFRRQNPAAVICLCGCFPQAFPDEAHRIPEADVVAGVRGRAGLLQAVGRRLAGEERVVDILPHQEGEGFEEMRTRGLHTRTRAFVKIQDGCERRCSYCIIPTARGPVRSKPLEAIKAELEGLSERGYREAVLVGINLSSYGRDLGLRLLDAVKLACDVPGLPRVRLGSLEPELLTSADIAALAALPALCPQFHLSLQSGSDTVLGRMRRPYLTADYRRIVADLREVFPGCAITTDIMVGFPGETQEEHAASLLFAREIGFAKAHVFAFSPRPGTAAAEMKGQLPGPEKVRRSREMAATLEGSRLAFLHAQIGSGTSVLFETRLADGRWEGYTPEYAPVLVPSGEDLAGQIRPVLVTGVAEELEHCTGILAEQDLGGAAPEPPPPFSEKGGRKT